MLLIIGQILAYLVGGVPFGYLIAKFHAGIDIRNHGSGNIGATNVGRVLGLRFFFIVFVLDFAKGALPVALALWFRAGADRTNPTLPNPVLGLPEVVGLAAILGHVFPLYLKFKGGKGVATAIGVIAVLAPAAGSIGLLAWGGLLIVSRMVAVASIGFATAFSLSHFLITDHPFHSNQFPLSGFVFVVAVLIVARHHSNIRRIIHGTEAKITMPWEKTRDRGDSDQGHKRGQ